MKHLNILLAVVLTAVAARAQDQKPPVRIAIIGLTHDHALGFIPTATNRPDIQLVGIVESNAPLVARYARRFHLATNLFFPSLEDLLAHTNVQAVATFTSTFEHRHVAEMCARLGIKTMMMEKPLAVNMEHARAMAAIAQQAGMQLLVNYETTWYPGNHLAYSLAVEQHALGDLRKIVVHDGHRGPKEIGCSDTFLSWLTDPILNGGGALNDFGCYGADLVTWLMEGQRPLTVSAVALHIKPDVYPKVEDDATIVITYPKAQAILQASWNWPFDRKDMEVYGRTGQVIIPTPGVVRERLTNAREVTVNAPPITGPDASSLSYLAAVVRGEIKPYGLSSLPVNMTVVEILDAAHESVRTGRRIDLPATPDYFPK